MITSSTVIIKKTFGQFIYTVAQIGDIKGLYRTGEVPKLNSNGLREADAGQGKGAKGDITAEFVRPPSHSQSSSLFAHCSQSQTLRKIDMGFALTKLPTKS